MQDYQARFVSDGGAIDHTPGLDVAAGAVVVQGGLVAIAKTPIAANAKGALAVPGVYDVVKAEEALASVGAKLYWDADGNPYNGTEGTGAATATAATNTFLGFVVVAALETDEVVRVLVVPSAAAAEAIGLADLSDVGAVAYTAGSILVGDGDSMEEVALSGPFNLSGAGLLSIDVATVAALGADQAGAAALADGFSLVTAANGAMGVRLPAAAAGGFCIVKNNAAAVLLLYPAVGDAIDALGANAAMDVPAYATVVLIAYDVTTWHSQCTLAEQALKSVQIAIQDFKKTDLVTALPTAGDGTSIGLVAGTHGTNGPSLQGKDVTGLTATTTDLARILIPLPADYVDGGDVKIRCHAGMLTTVADTSATLDCQAYETDEEAGIGSDLCSTDAQDINSLVLADVDFVIDGTGLVAGDVLDLELTTVTEQTGTAAETIPFIGAVKLLYDKK